VIQIKTNVLFILVRKVKQPKFYRKPWITRINFIADECCFKIYVNCVLKMTKIEPSLTLIKITPRNSSPEKIMAIIKVAKTQNPISPVNANINSKNTSGTTRPQIKNFKGWGKILTLKTGINRLFVYCYNLQLTLKVTSHKMEQMQYKGHYRHFQRPCFRQNPKQFCCHILARHEQQVHPRFV
jgi:hypothetical protein